VTSPSHFAVSVEFLPISVLWRFPLILPKAPRGSRQDTSSLYFFIAFFYCLSTKLSTVFFSLFHFVRSFRSSLISYFSLSSTAVLLPLYPLFFLSLCGLSSFSVSSRIYFFLVVSPSSRSTLAISFSSSPTRWFPTISPSDFLLLLLLRPRQGFRREITLINWSISKARSNSVRGYLRIYTLREGAQRRATMKPGI